MNTSQIMALADAYAAAEQHDYLTGEASADHARAALEAALTEKQEPVAWMYQNANTDSEYLVWKRSPGGRNWTPLYTHLAPVNQALLEACKAALSDDQPYIEKCRAAIAAAEGK